MPLDLVGALLGWLVSLVGDAGIRLMRRSPDELALRRALGLAIDRVVQQANLSSQEVLREGLRQCFSASPQLGLDASASVSDGLRAAIEAQLAQLDQMMHSDSGDLFYDIVRVDRVWLIDQVTAAIRTALPQVAAASSLAELVNVLNAEGLSTQLDALAVQISELRYQGPAASGHSGAQGATAWRGPVWVVPPLRGDEVARPGLMEQLMAAVMRAGVGAVGMTTGLWGAGGFGKTTMVRMLVHRQEVREEFPDGVVWVTIGEDVAGPELAEKITNVVGLVRGDRPPLTDPLAAGAELGRALGDRRLLMVVDDVWTSAQVEPFLVGGPAAVRLFTTRVRGVLPRSAEWVQVDEMDRSEAAQLLIAGVSGASGGVVEGLLAASGRWPVLLALINGAVRADLGAGRPANESMREILLELRTTGPTVLDIADADERHTAVARTIAVSLTRLTADQQSRYLELAVFGEGVAIPGPVLARYWRATGGWSQFQSQRYCQRLAELALVSEYRHDPEQVVLHDVLRAYLCEKTAHRRGELHRALIDAHRSLDLDEGETKASWLAMQSYLWAWLPTHLRGAELMQELQACLHHPRWLIGKLEYVGPAGLEADLALSDDLLSKALRTAVRQNGHVLGPLEPPDSLTATLATRLSPDGRTRVIRDELLAGLTRPHLRAITAFSDLPHPALSRVLAGHTSSVFALGVAPDGYWLASAGQYDGEVRIWDLATGTIRHIFTRHTRAVSALAVAPDGSWLASASGAFHEGWDVRIWDTATGTIRHTLTGHDREVGALAVAPDGSWLASASSDIYNRGDVRIWDTATGTIRHTLTGHDREVGALAVAPDGSWLASADSGGDVRVWDPTTGTIRHIFTRQTRAVSALAVAPDGSWLASASGEQHTEGQVLIWDPVTGTPRHTRIGHTRGMRALACSPDGSWLASGGYNGEVLIWDPATGRARHTLTDSSGEVLALAVAPDGSWLASAAGSRGEVRIWDPTTGTPRQILTGHTSGVLALAVAPDGSWLASGGNDTEVRIWEPTSGATSYTHTGHTGHAGHTGKIVALAVPQDRSWLASASTDGEVRIWDPITGTSRHILPGYTRGLRALVVAPDGSWLASSGHDRVLRIWNPTTGSTRDIPTGHGDWVMALVVAPDGSWLASADFDGEIRIWDTATGTVRHILGPDREVRALAVAPDGSWLASANVYGDVGIWDPTTGTACHTLAHPCDDVRALAVAPDGSWLASGGNNGEVVIWDPITGRARHTLTGHTRGVWALAGAPDGSWLASANDDGDVRIWDPATGSIRHILRGHTRWVEALAVAPDGTWLASAGGGGEIRIWDPITGAPITSLRVAGDLSHILLASTTIAAAGQHGPYFLALCPGNQPG